MSYRNNRRPGLGLELLEGRLAPSGGLGGHQGAAEVQHHAAGGHHAAAAHHAGDDHAAAGRKGGKDDGPAHR